MLIEEVFVIHNHTVGSIFYMMQDHNITSQKPKESEVIRTDGVLIEVFVLHCSCVLSDSLLPGYLDAIAGTAAKAGQDDNNCSQDRVK